VVGLLARLSDLLGRTGFVRPAAVAGLGAAGVTVARHNTEHAPVVVFGAVAAVVIATALRERGAAVAALGAAATAAFTTPSGLGPLLVATGVVIAARPALVNRRVAQWPEIVDAVIALPAAAGLAGVAAAQPSERGGVVAAAAGLFLLTTWWRGPRHDARPPRVALASYAGAIGAIVVTLAPDRVDALGPLPAATVTAERGVAAGLGVFAVVWVIDGVRALRAPAPAPRQVYASHPPSGPRAQHATGRPPR
jgi:hypothetical protein